ncbi:MAG: hypothetical protein ACI8W8_005052, partial [Rhodothermales bacterium]
MFNVPAAAATPDLEALIVDSSARIAEFARLQPMMISWLLRYEKWVCRHRLAVMASQIDSAFHPAALGYTLALAAEHSGRSHWNVAIRACAPLTSRNPYS